MGLIILSTLWSTEPVTTVRVAEADVPQIDIYATSTKLVQVSAGKNAIVINFNNSYSEDISRMINEFKNQQGSTIQFFNMVTLEFPPGTDSNQIIDIPPAFSKNGRREYVSADILKTNQVLTVYFPAQANPLRDYFDAALYVNPVLLTALTIVINLDDSTVVSDRQEIDDFCLKHSINVIRRGARQGYKAGALNNALRHLPEGMERTAF